ncbi:ATP-binding protein [bacterium AH-315-A03]|nr:ATP-binding protein [bacterium AH-315-A03]
MTEDTELVELELRPPPGALVRSLRSLGYTPATAIADLIDNSITAQAKNIRVDMEWRGTAADSRVTVADDGIGMNYGELCRAMTPGSSSPSDPREADDLGRFGLGMKTASWSMGKRQTVRSVKDGDDRTLCWDLDHVEDRGEWMVISDPEDPPANLLRLPGTAQTGTVVVVERCDKIFGEEEPDAGKAEAAFYEKVEETTVHLEMAFHRFLARGRSRGKSGVKITVNGNQCLPWDPFLTGHRWTQDLGEERLSCSGEELLVQPYVLPHRDHLDEKTQKRAGGPKGWNLQQGFYIYRAERLIVAGGWFGSGDAKPEEHTKLARVRVDLTQGMDSAWHLNVLKSEARPPASLRKDFGRIGQAVRSDAKKAYQYRGRKAIGGLKHRPAIPMWTAEQRGSGPLSFRINRQHDLVSGALDAPAGHKKIVVALLRHLERTVPVARILIAGYENEEQLDWDDTDTEKLSADAKLIYRMMRAANFPHESAKDRLRHLQPFIDHPEIVEGIGEDEDDNT